MDFTDGRFWLFKNIVVHFNDDCKTESSEEQTDPTTSIPQAPFYGTLLNVCVLLCSVSCGEDKNSV